MRDCGCPNKNLFKFETLKASNQGKGSARKGTAGQGHSRVPGHGRAARAEQAGQGHSRVPKPPKNAFSRPGKLKMLVLELLKARAWQGS